ncbi:MAG: hypothetical protein K8L99_21665 [Anaerolineae bacterium]|nr:hypothetical protein [Anaerolineae bacterium]
MQFGIAVGVLGVVLTFMGLFPGVTGVEPTPGIGFVQILLIVTGFSLLITGAFIYVKYTFYDRHPANLAQQIGIRLAMTGLIFGAMAGLADILGFGSNLRTLESDIYFGPWQAIGLLGGFLMASIGVLIYAVTGSVADDDTP